MTTPRDTRRRQSGQALVIIAGAMVAILAMVALVLMGGAAYWERRHLQELADSAALAASLRAGGDCTSAQALVVGDMARNVLEAQLGPHTSGPSVSGTCPGPGWVVSYGFSDGTTADINWPYANHSNDWVQATVRHTIPLQLPGFVGNVAAIGATAIAEANSANHPGAFALYAYRGINCKGSGIIIIKGSIYSGGPIDTNCSIYAKEVKAGSPATTIDFGDILVFPNQPLWNRGGGNCGAILSGKPSNAICADGYEESGDPATCALPFSSGGTSYVDPTQLQPGPGGVVPNPMPCPGDSVPGPQWNLTPDPNTFGTSAMQFTGGVPCPVGAPSVSSTSYATATFPGAKGPVMRASAPVDGAAAKSPDGNGLWHFHPGCYAWIDIANVPGGTAVLDPGFYFFNGFFAGGDPSGVSAGGLALNAANSRLLGQDVTLEFANPPGGASSFSGTEIKPAGATTSSCGGGSSCFVGADPAAKINGFGLFSAPCSNRDPLLDARCPTAGSSWCRQTDTSCYDVLVWAPPPGTTTEPAVAAGSFWFKGTGSFEWMYGAVEWPSNCAWSANGDSILVGNLICDTANIQGGSISSGPTVQFGSKGKNHFNNEPGLKA